VTLVPGQIAKVQVLFAPTAGGTGLGNKKPTTFRSAIQITASVSTGTVLRGSSSRTLQLLGKSIGVLPISRLPTVMVFPNPGDANLATFGLANGSQVTFSGTKNENGIPQSVTGLPAGC